MASDDFIRGLWMHSIENSTSRNPAWSKSLWEALEPKKPDARLGRTLNNAPTRPIGPVTSHFEDWPPISHN